MDPERYNFKVVEEKWQNYWLKNKLFKAEEIDLNLNSNPSSIIFFEETF